MEEKKQVVLIFDLQNIVGFLKDQREDRDQHGEDRDQYVRLFVSSLKDISEQYGEPTTPQFAVPCHLPESIIDSLRKIEDTECLIVKALPQLPGGIDQVDEIIKRMIKEAVNNEKVGTILLVSGDRDFRSVIRNANRQNKQAIQISPQEMLKIFEEKNTKEIIKHLRSAIESKKDPFPAILIKLQSNEAILPEEKRGLTFLSLIRKALLNIYQTEKAIPFNKLSKQVWDILNPKVRGRDKIERQKFTYRHCRDALLAILAYTDLLHQDQEGIRCNLQSTLLSKLKKPGS